MSPLESDLGGDIFQLLKLDILTRVGALTI